MLNRLAVTALALGLALAGHPSGTNAQAPARRPDVRYLPTPQNVVDAMLDLAHVTSTDIVYDLGSGDGRIPITAARKYGARGVGIELDPTLVRLSEENASAAGVQPLVRFITGDLFEQDFSEATVVALFLYPGMNIELIPRLRALRPGSRIVSHHFAMADRWLPDETRDVNGLEIYLWIVR